MGLAFRDGLEFTQRLIRDAGLLLLELLYRVQDLLDLIARLIKKLIEGQASVFIDILVHKDF